MALAFSASDGWRPAGGHGVPQWIAFGKRLGRPLLVHPPRAVDCGVSDEMPPNAYDPTAPDCVWSAYSMGTPSRWTVMLRTVEG